MDIKHGQKQREDQSGQRLTFVGATQETGSQLKADSENKAIASGQSDTGARTTKAICYRTSLGPKKFKKHIIKAVHGMAALLATVVIAQAGHLAFPLQGGAQKFLSKIRQITLEATKAVIENVQH